MDFQKEIKELRQRTGLSQAKFAKNFLSQFIMWKHGKWESASHLFM